MPGAVPQVHQGRDGAKQLYAMVNQLRRDVPGPTSQRYPLVLNLLTLGPTIIVPAGVKGFVPSYVDIVLRTVTGAVVVPAQVEFGSNATYDNVAAATVIPGGTLADEVVPVMLAATTMSLTGPIYANVTVVPTGVTVYTVELYVTGYWRT